MGGLPMRTPLNPELRPEYQACEGVKGLRHARVFYVGALRSETEAYDQGHCPVCLVLDCLGFKPGQE